MNLILLLLTTINGALLQPIIECEPTYPDSYFVADESSVCKFYICWKGESTNKSCPLGTKLAADYYQGVNNPCDTISCGHCERASLPRFTPLPVVKEWGFCESNPCLNHGKCHERLGGFWCSCRPGYKGSPTCHPDNESQVEANAQMEIPSEEVEEKSEEVSRTYRIPTSTSFTTSAEESVERTEAETPRITEAVITEITSLGKTCRINWDCAKKRGSVCRDGMCHCRTGLYNVNGICRPKSVPSTTTPEKTTTPEQTTTTTTTEQKTTAETTKMPDSTKKYTDSYTRPSSLRTRPEETTIEVTTTVPTSTITYMTTTTYKNTTPEQTTTEQSTTTTDVTATVSYEETTATDELTTRSIYEEGSTTPYKTEEGSTTLYENEEGYTTPYEENSSTASTVSTTYETSSVTLMNQASDATEVPLSTTRGRRLPPKVSQSTTTTTTTTMPTTTVKKESSSASTTNGKPRDTTRAGIKIGDLCEFGNGDTECEMIPGARCSFKKCSCRFGTVFDGHSQCIKAPRLGEGCSSDKMCSFVRNSVCSAGRCRCAVGYYQFSPATCFRN